MWDTVVHGVVRVCGVADLPETVSAFGRILQHGARAGAATQPSSLSACTRSSSSGAICRLLLLQYEYWHVCDGHA